MTRVIRAQRVALCILALLVGAFFSTTQPEHAAAMDPIPLPIKLPSPALVKGFNQIAAHHAGGMPAAVHAAIYYAEQQAWPSQAVCKGMPYGCWPSITSQWGANKVVGYDNPMAFRDGGYAQEGYFAYNQDRGYGQLRLQLYLLYSGGAYPDQIPNRAIQYASIDDAVDWTVKYYKFLAPRMQRVLTRPRKGV